MLVIKMFSKFFRVLKCLVSSIAWYIFSNAEIDISEPASQDDMPSDYEPKEETLPIYVDEQLIPPIPASTSLNDDNIENDTHVDIRAEVESFLNHEISDFPVDASNWKNFEVWTLNTAKLNESTEMDVDDDSYLDVKLQVVPQGYIINTNVYLSNQQWNTLVNNPEFTFYCAVCSCYCDSVDHIKLDTHCENLCKHRPLYKFDLSIVRKIIEYLHCGVCNIVFHESEEDDHFVSKEHEDKMLFALNKASDIMYDYNINDKKETYHFSAKAINERHLDLTSSDESDGDDATDSDDVPDSDDWYNDPANSYGGLRFVEPELDEDDEHFYDNVEPPLALEHSYASMARRPKTDELPKVLEIDLGKKKITVNINSWNMVINPKRNGFYCMVCKEFGHVRGQAEHCRNLAHVERLARCQIIDSYDSHLVRQVDDKLYHCGHCNNLQLIHDMDDHIEAQHNISNRLTSPAKSSTPIKTPSKTTVFNDKENCKNAINNITVKLNFDSDTSLLSNGKEQMCQENLMRQDMLLANSNIFDDIVLCTYGKAITITKMAYNILCERETDYYCGLCETMVEKDKIKDHVNSLQHLVLLQNAAFLEYFNVHLFREIREAVHCAICNVLIPMLQDMIHAHKYEATHASRLLKSVKDITNGSTPVIQVTEPVDTRDKIIKNAVDNDHDVNGETAVMDEDTSSIDSDDIDNVDSEDSNFKEEFVYVKLGNTYIKITNTAYHTLVAVGDGSRHCFVCSSFVYRGLKKHVNSRGHMESMEKVKFVEKYKEDLLRQIYLIYHCSICNVIVRRKDLAQHLQWPTHTIQAEDTRVNAKERKTDIKDGVKQYEVNLVKENIYLNENESTAKILLNVTIEKDKVEVAKKNKIIIFKNNVLKIPFESWHSVSETPEGWRCKMCQCDFNAIELENHIASEWHITQLEKFDLTFTEALVRRINYAAINCVMCNAEIMNKENLIQEHVHGKKHRKVYQAILEESAGTNSYSDCEDKVLTL